MLSLHLPSALAAFGAAAAAFGLSTPMEHTAPSAHAVIPAASTTASAPTAVSLTPQRHSVRRAPDGLFYVTAQANGETVRFVVDTGASVVVLTRKDAERLGIDHASLTGRAKMNTVGGKADMRWATIDTMHMAGRKLESVDAAVVEGGLPVSLLGQNALEKLGTVTLRGDQLTIE